MYFLFERPCTKGQRKPLDEWVLAESEYLHYANLALSADKLEKQQLQSAHKTLLIIEVATAAIKVKAPTKGVRRKAKRIKFVWKVASKISSRVYTLALTCPNSCADKLITVKIK